MTHIVYPATLRLIADAMDRFRQDEDEDVVIALADDGEGIGGTPGPGSTLGVIGGSELGDVRFAGARSLNDAPYPLTAADLRDVADIAESFISATYDVGLGCEVWTDHDEDFDEPIGRLVDEVGGGVYGFRHATSLTEVRSDG